MKARLIGAALLALVSFPAMAEQRCVNMPVDRGVAALEESGATNVTFLTGTALATGAQFYNSLPPASDMPWPIVMVADMPDGVGFLAVGIGRVFCDRIIIPADKWEAIKKAIVGPAA